MKIQLDKPRKIEFTMRALRTFKEETNKSLLKDGLNNPDESDLFALAYAGLVGANKDFDKELTKEALEGYLDLKKLMDVLAYFADTVSGSSDDKEVKK